MVVVAAATLVKWENDEKPEIWGSNPFSDKTIILGFSWDSTLNPSRHLNLN